MRKLVVMLLIAALASGMVSAAVAGGKTSGLRRVASFGEVSVAGAQGSRYIVRLRYAVPASWPLRGKRTGLRRRFGPVGSCRIGITIWGAAVADRAEPATGRVTRLLPANGGRLLDYGTRGNAAYRVVRTSGRKDKEVVALLVKPAPNVSAQPDVRRVWLELRARAVADPKTECHAGGPRTVGVALGDALASARAGGFQPVAAPVP
jgi:hypothetical protein